MQICLNLITPEGAKRMASNKRLSVPLSTHLEDGLGEIAKGYGTSLAEAAETMIALGMTVEALRLKGGEVIHRHNGKERIIADSEGRYINSPRMGTRKQLEE